jgi:transposase
MADRITYGGLDVHKDSIVVAVAAGGLRGEVREHGRIANTPAALDRLLRKLGGDSTVLRFCYEAGPCGYGIQRRLSARRQECVVVAPSLIPKRAGDRVKTDDHRCGRPELDLPLRPSVSALKAAQQHPGSFGGSLRRHSTEIENA